MEARPRFAPTLPHLLAAQAGRIPGAVAVTCGSESLTYAELNNRANRLAHQLISRGIGPEDRVVLAMPRTADLIVALWGILKAGAAYVPIDLSYPADRIAYLLKDARPACAVTTAGGATRLDEVTPLIPGAPGGQLESNPTDQDRTRPLSPQHPAYVCYTSGSTGWPKGVVATHDNVVNLIAWEVAQFGIERFRLVLAATTLSFDAAVCETILPLAAGGRLELIGSILDLADRTCPDASLICTVPSALSALLARGARPRTGLIALGGEALPPPLVRQIRAELPGTRILNVYGPTECTVNATYWEDDGSRVDVVPIGRPVHNTRAYVLDADLRLVPVGVPGELYLAGLGVTRGYLNRPALTAERFVASPYGSPGERMYRTGDRARWTESGAIEYLGRLDRQVKVRGFRIELGEIEAALLRSGPVTQAAALVREDRPGDTRLVVYVVGRGADPARLRQEAARSLPAPLIPMIVLLDELPVTPGGKLDYQKLPAPDHVPQSVRRLPGSPLERSLCSIFAQVLGIPSVGVTDDFFDLGGHSLLAMRLASRIRSDLGKEIPVQSIFEEPSPAGLARISGASAASRPVLRHLPRSESAPLSPAQLRLWYLNELDGATDTYNLPVATRLSGPLDRQALQLALADVVRRHEILRTRYPAPSGVPNQQVLDADSCQVALNVVPTSEALLGSALRKAAHQGFDLATDPPLRASLFVLDDHDHVLLLLLHHIAADAASLRPLGQDLATAYGARLAGQAPSWPPLQVQYSDYVRWQRELLGRADDPDSVATRQAAFWRQTLARMPQQLRLPADRPRSARPGRDGRTVEFLIDATTSQRLAELAMAGRATLFMALQASVAALLTRMGAGTDIPLGIPVVGRSDEALDDVVGFFVNTLVLRMSTSRNPSFRDLIARARNVDLAAYAHQDLPFERVVEMINPVRARGRQPLFQVMVSFQNEPSSIAGLPGLSARAVRVPLTSAKFDLSFDFTPQSSRDGSPAGIGCVIEYATELFDKATIQATAARLARLLAAVVADPDQRIGDTEILSPHERRQLLAGWNDTSRPLPQDTIPAIFEAQARSTPERQAIHSDGTSLTFAELNAAANRLAHHLAACGIGTEDIVAMALPPSAEMITVLLAVLKTGAAYLPIDPTYPDQRISLLLIDARPALVISDERTAANTPRFAGHQLLLLDAREARRQIAQCPESDLTGGSRVRSLRPDNCAYLIYTSGSTGRPKGVMVEHASLVNLLRSHQTEFFAPAIRAAGVSRIRAALTASLSFDTSWDALLWMLSGHEVYVPADDIRRDPQALAAFIRRHKIDFLDLTPSFFHQLLAAGTLAATHEHQPKIIMLGAEPVLAPMWERVADAPATTGYNFYGPTECTVDALFQPITAGSSPSIGRPIRNTRAYVLDERMRPMPAGVSGELYLAGAGVARGYRGHAALTAERFVACPFGPPGTRMYRTGDIARWRSDGTMEFLGRVDDQVKIRGFRVEPGEVAAAIAGTSQVGDVAVVPRQDHSGRTRLVAYIVALEPGAGLDVPALRRSIADLLPDYMIPAAFVMMEALPFGPNGKLNRSALPEPALPVMPVGREPASPREHILSQLFADLLAVNRVSADDDFFELGGDSLLSIQLVRRASAEGVVVTPQDVLQHRTVAALASAQHRAVVVEDSSAGIGDTPPTPVMHWWTDRHGPIKLFRESKLLLVPGGLKLDRLVLTVQELLDRHHVLRGRIVPDVGRTKSLRIAPPGQMDAHACVRRAEHADTSDDEMPAMLVELEAAARKRLDDPTRPAIEVCWLDAGQQRPGRLLLTVRHPVADAVSWQILCHDIAVAWAGHDPDPRLTEPGTSFRRWAMHLAEHAGHLEIEEEMATWIDIVRSSDSLRPGAPGTASAQAPSRLSILTFTLAPERTMPLLRSVPASIHGHTGDVLLIALALAVTDWRTQRGASSADGVLIDVEHHGRSHLTHGLDLSRTVGWLTSVFPARLDPGRMNRAELWDDAQALGRAARAMAEQLHAIPRAGLGYGLLRYLNPRTADRLARLSSAEIAFNYVGRRRAPGTGVLWSDAPEAAALARLHHPHSSYDLEVSAVTTDLPEGPQLSVTWSWRESLLSQAEVRNLTRAWVRALDSLAAVLG